MESWILNAHLIYNIFWFKDPLCNTSYINVSFINKCFALLYVWFQIIVQFIPIIQWKQACIKLSEDVQKSLWLCCFLSLNFFLKKFFYGSKCQEVWWLPLWMDPELNSAKNNDAKSEMTFTNKLRSVGSRLRIFLNWLAGCFRFLFLSFLFLENFQKHLAFFVFTWEGDKKDLLCVPCVSNFQPPPLQSLYRVSNLLLMNWQFINRAEAKKGLKFKNNESRLWRIKVISKLNWEIMTLWQIALVTLLFWTSCIQKVIDT